MNIQIISDLHIEFKSIEIPKIERDLLVIAGDFNAAMKGVDIIKDQCSHSPVILVLGNHDFYGSSIQEVVDFWNNVKIDNFHFLFNNNVVINDINFIGSTLFPDFLNGNPSSMLICQQSINDFKGYIFNNKEKKSKITPNDYLYLSKIDKDYVMDAFEKSTSSKNVIISHYLPSEKSIHPKYKDSQQSLMKNGAFLSNLDNFIHYKQPNLMIHGHTHCSFDYKIGETRIICNPRGVTQYDGDIGFKLDKVIKI
jgi:Icc-related predicted phosphoesterase